MVRQAPGVLATFALSTNSQSMVSVPLPTVVGAKVRFRTQPLPVLTNAQPKGVGPLQPVGSVVPEIANPEIARPSLEVKVTLTVWLAPVTTDTVPAMEEVATTESLVPVSPVPPPEPALPGPVLPVLPVLPVVTLAVPVVLLMELAPQPDKTRRKKAPTRSERWPNCIPIQPIIERVQGYAGGAGRRVNCVTQWHVAASFVTHP